MEIFYICHKDCGNDILSEGFIIGDKEEAKMSYQMAILAKSFQKGDCIELSQIERDEIFDLILKEIYDKRNTTILTNIATDYF